MSATVGTSFESSAEPQPSSHLGGVLLTFWGVVTFLGGVWWALEPDGLFLALGAVACLVVTLPLTRPYSSIMSPWTLVAAITYVGCGLRGAFLSAGVDTTDRALSQFLLLNRSPEYFLVPTVMYVAATALMTTVFMLRPRTVREPAPSSRTSSVFSGPVVGLSIPLALIGAGSFLQYVRVTGGFNLASLSAKRTTITGLDLDASYTSHGDLLFLNSLGSIALWIVVAHYVSSGRRISWVTKEGWFTAALALNSIALPFYASSRSDALLTLLAAGGIAIMLRPRALPLKSIVIGGGVLLVLISTMTHLRSASNAGPVTTLTSAMVDGAADAFVYNRGLSDPTVAAHIYHAVPDRIAFQNGATITTWALAPIPRAIWPEKPIVNFGPVIGNVIYGNARSGVPPGWVGDLYLNWGLPAVLAGSVLLGWVLSQIDRWRLRQVVYTPAFVVLYVPLSLVASKNLMIKGIGSAAFNGGIQFALTALCLLWIGALRPKAKRREAGPLAQVASRT